MSKLILYILFISIIITSKSYSESKCEWANEPGVACINIVKKINNTSEFSEENINKYIITKEEINKVGSNDLIDILKTIPGLNFTQSGPKGQQASLFMRGTGSNHTLVMINGIPINDQSTTQGLHDFGVDFIQTIQQIEVFPGSSASQFGTNAIGGAINIVLAGDYEDKISFFSDNKSNYSFSSNKTSIFDENVVNFKVGAVREEKLSVRSGDNEDKDKVNNLTLNLNHEKYLSPSTKFFNTVYTRQTVSEYDGSTSNQEGFEGDNKMFSIQSGLKSNDRNNNYDETIFYYTKYDREYDENGTIDNYYSDLFGLKYQLSRKYNEIFSYGLGSDYSYNWGEFENRGSYQASTKGNIDNLALFSNLGIKIADNKNLSLFLRNDNHKKTGNNSTYKISYNHKIKNLDFNIARMTGLRNPTIYELFGTDNFGYSGNRDLNPEKSVTNEIGFKLNLKQNIDFSSTFFKSNINNNIEYISNKYQNDNDDIDLNQSGIDLMLELNEKNSSLKFYSSFLSSKKENGADQLRRPRKNYGIKYFKKIYEGKNEEFNFNISYNHYGKHFDTHSGNFSTVEMDSTDIIDLILTKKFGNFDFYLNISNLFDETYQRPHGYNQEKRFLKIGVKY